MSKPKDQGEMVGVIGPGSFGLAIASMLAKRNKVLLYVHKQAHLNKLNEQSQNTSQRFLRHITPINDLAFLSDNCEVIFPIIPAISFRKMIKELAPFLRPYHILIHGVKGLNSKGGELLEISSFQESKGLTREQVKTISEVISEETVVKKIGCLAGPNLAKEMYKKQPTASIIASKFEEVIDKGKKLLQNDWFQICGTNDILGVELCGALKNIIGIAAGCLAGLRYGENAKGLLISQGIAEMITIGKAFGATIKPFIGVAGIGDLVVTCSSKLSRNYTLGYLLAKGREKNCIMTSMQGVAEGVHTVKIIQELFSQQKVSLPITKMVYEILFKEKPIKLAIKQLMEAS